MRKSTSSHTLQATAVPYSRDCAATRPSPVRDFPCCAEHARRLLDSGKIYRMQIPYTIEQLVEGMLEVVRVQWA